MNNNIRHLIGWWLIFFTIRTPLVLKSSNQKFSLRKQMRSFVHAINGLKILLIEEHNFRIHLAATIFVVIASFILKIEKIEGLIILISIAFVFSCEIINTAIENLADFVSPEYHDQIKKVKDISAAAVFVSTIFTFVIGVIIFIPKLF